MRSHNIHTTKHINILNQKDRWDIFESSCSSFHSILFHIYHFSCMFLISQNKVYAFPFLIFFLLKLMNSQISNIYREHRDTLIGST